MNTSNDSNERQESYRSFVLTIIIITVILNVFSWMKPSFSDEYTMKVFPIWVKTYGKLTSQVPFSVGEIMIIAGLLWLVAIPFSKWIRERTLGLLAIIALVMTLNCFINYHCTPIKESYDEKDREFTVSELAQLRDFIVDKCNELSAQIPRDENNEIIADDEKMKEVAKGAMGDLGERFPKLEGFYVTPKPLYFSEFMSQQYMQGYYFPFSMEANYNDIMYVMNKPFTMCHELAHTKSYIFEDEANFLAYLACTNSDDVLFKYSGYLGVLNYVNNAFYENVSKEEYLSHVAISDAVKADNIFLTKENWERVEKNAVIETETVKKAADTFVDTTLKVNGVDDGKASYNRVVELMLLEFYSGK